MNFFNFSKSERSLYLIIFIILFTLKINAQETISGKIIELIGQQEQPILGANVYWLNTTVGTVTNEEGTFNLPYKNEYKQLIISYVGYKTDTLNITNTAFIKHNLTPTNNLNEVVVKSRKQATAKSYLNAENTLFVSSDELLKAACCNLSESFETNPSIDVNFTDAISGTRQIKMLGLDSPYILIATENIPSVRGAAQTFGLSFIPGTWVESIQITKGAGSVINGFESIGGQINAELQKPTTDAPLFVNAYAGINGRYELNTHINTKVNQRWSTGLYLHGNIRNDKFDRNNDNFLDVPLKQQINLLNRWQYTHPEKGIVSFINIKYLLDETQAGQINFNPETDRLTTRAWGSVIDTERFEFSAKLGYVNPEIPYQTLGLQTAYSFHDQNSYFGLRTYDIAHESIYANLIYNSIITDSRHKIKTGASFTYDAYEELVEFTPFNRIENSLGGFFEYAYDDLDKLTLTAGIRADQHNRLGFFVTPRLHIRYTPWEKSAWRASIGRGKRSANIFAENLNLFASNRQINILNTGGKIYGLDPEVAWNYGVSYLQGFNLFNRKADVTFDYYSTQFTNQVVVDWENPFEINFYNLDGKSFANSFQVELNYNLFENAELRTAYKFYDVQTDYLSGKFIKPLTPQHRFFTNIEYKTNITKTGSQWRFDATYNWLGKQRFAATALSPEAFQLDEFSPSVGTVNFQITKVFSSQFEVYLGGENINDVRQNNPIISAENPFGANFDSNFVYGPIFGSMYYAGLRFKLNKL